MGLTKARALRAYARMVNTLDASHLEPFLADDFHYGSQRVFEEITSRQAFLDYIRPKLESMARSGSRTYAGMAELDVHPRGPCVVLAQGTKSNLLATVLAEVEEGCLKRLDLCQIPPPSAALRTGEYPKARPLGRPARSSATGEARIRCFEILVAESAVSVNGGGFVPDDRLTYGIPDELQDLLKPILAPYGQDPMWYFDNLNFGRAPAPWALACLDREHAIAGHVATTRPHGAGIGFAPYSPLPMPIPSDLVPGVGVLAFESKHGLQRSAGESRLLATAWDALRQCSADQRWLVILDPLPERWLSEVLPVDRERWRTRGNIPVAPAERSITLADRERRLRKAFLEAALAGGAALAEAEATADAALASWRQRCYPLIRGRG
jgi:hypothetical protein